MYKWLSELSTSDRDSIRELTRTATLAGFAFGSARIITEYLALAPMGCDMTLMFDALTLLYYLTGPVVLLVCILTAINRRTRLLALKICILLTFFSAPFSICGCIATQVRMRGYEALAERSEPLINSIVAYEEAKGEAPAKLEDLVPEFQAQVPTTGIGTYPNYEYMQSPTGPSKETGQWLLRIRIHRIHGVSECFYSPSPAQRKGFKTQKLGRDWLLIEERAYLPGISSTDVSVLSRQCRTAR